MYTQLEQVASLAYILGGEEEGLQKTAGIFGTLSRTLRRPLVGPWRQVGKELSEEIQQKIVGRAQRHALAAADPSKLAPSRWYHQWRANSARDNLVKEYGMYSNMLAAEANGLIKRISHIEKALNTPGLTPAARGQLEQQLRIYKLKVGRSRHMINNMQKKVQDMGMPEAIPQPYIGGQTTGTQATGTQTGGTQTTGTQTGGTQTPGTKPLPTPPPGTMPSFFEKYGPETLTRSLANRFFADPAKMTMLGVGGLYGTSQIGVPVIKNIFGVEDK